MAAKATCHKCEARATLIQLAGIDYLSCNQCKSIWLPVNSATHKRQVTFFSMLGIGKSKPDKLGRFLVGK